MSPSDTRLRMRGVAKSFGATRALEQVDLEVGAGEVHALIGENGAGKSTLMKILSGALRPDAGSILLEGSPYAPNGPLAARRRGVAMIYQELTLAPDLSVAENILLGNQPSAFGLVSGRRQREIARHALAQLGREDLPLDAPVRTLSVAQQQMVEIARALAGAPRVLVMDEPTSSLTRRDTEHLFAAIDRLKARGVSVIYISHFLEECQAVADRWTVLRDGRSIASGAMAEATVPDLIRMMVGREVADIYPRVPHQPGEPLLEVTALAGQGRPIAAGFTVRRGEILGLFGLVGSGRSETLRALFGLDPTTAGRVLFAGVEATGRSPHAQLAAGMGLVSEDRKDEGLLLERSLADNLTLTRLGPFRRLGLIDARRQQAATRGWMERLGIKAAGPAQPIGQLSGGNQQKVAIGRLLHHQARLILLDEPTRGVDVGAKAAIYQLIGELAAQGTAVVMVSSYLPELLGICDSIAVMCRGVLGPARPAAEWDAHAMLAAAIGQEAA